MAKPRFKIRALQRLYEGCRQAAIDNWSEMYQARTTAGLNPSGPNAPQRGAGVRCAYWDGRMGVGSLYSRGPYNILAHAAYAAGQDDAKDAARRIKARDKSARRGA